MIQQLLAFIVIAFFLSRLFWQKRRKGISGNEFLFWLVFWLAAILAVVFIKKIDELVSGLGFSASGIEVLLYLGVVLLFYMVFRLRLKYEKIEKQVTEVVRHIALDKDNTKKNEG